MKTKPWVILPSFAFTIAALVVLLPKAAVAEEVNLKLMSEGAMPKLGGYIPQRLTLSNTKPEGLKKIPAGLTAPLYGSLKLGPKEAPTTFYLLLDEPADKPARLFVDSTGSGEISESTTAEWSPRSNQSSEGKKLTMYSGGPILKVPAKGETLALHVPMYRFDKKDPQRAAFTNMLFYYSDYARSGEVNLGDKAYSAMLIDDAVTGDFRGKEGSKSLLLDVNGDGKFDRRREGFDLKEPFNIGGATYEIHNVTAAGSPFEIVKSDKSVPETKPPMVLTAGKQALTFEAATTDGKPVKFPATYKGKLVMLDFWATWCGPCVGELPNLTKAYQKFHGQGFEVLGVSLDRENAKEKLAGFTKEHEMPWPQIYDGKFWQAQVAKKYEIESIPSAFLIDGDTGVIVASGQDLRGEELSGTVEKALAKKKKSG